MKKEAGDGPRQKTFVYFYVAASLKQTFYSQSLRKPVDREH